MSIESNKKDFENALDYMRNAISTLESCVDPSILSILTDVIHEYDHHYVNDIEELITEVEELRDTVDNLDREISYLENEVGSLDL